MVVWNLIFVLNTIKFINTKDYILYTVYIICTPLFLNLILERSLRKNVTMHHTFLHTP